MANCSHCKVILEKSQTKGSRTHGVGVPLSPSSSFPPFFKSPGAGSSFYNNFSHIYTLTNSNVSTTSTGGYLIGHGYG